MKTFPDIGLSERKAVRWTLALLSLSTGLGTDNENHRAPALRARRVCRLISLQPASTFTCHSQPSFPTERRDSVIFGIAFVFFIGLSCRFLGLSQRCLQAVLRFRSAFHPGLLFSAPGGKLARDGARSDKIRCILVSGCSMDTNCSAAEGLLSHRCLVR